MLQNESDKHLCTEPVSKESIKKLREFIKLRYIVDWSVDGLPAAYKEQGAQGEVYRTGFPLGYVDNRGNIFLYNHVNLKIKYFETKEREKPYRIVFFEVSPGRDGLELNDNVQSINYTYSVEFIKDSTPWSNRWDLYIYMQKGESQIHWFNIINSFMIVLLLSGMIAMIMMRTLKADFNRYNSEDPEDSEETGWKLVHGDVFRPPPRPMLFSILVGSGVQVLGMTLIVLAIAVLGFLSPANRGLLLTSMLFLFVWMAFFAGYASTRTYKILNGQNWKKNGIATSLFFPGIVFAIFFFLNFFLWGKHSSRAVPFGTLVALIVMWLGIAVPLCLFGSFLAYKKETPKQPVRTTLIPRQIPNQQWYMHPLFSILVGGILPFGAVFIELFYILTSVWFHQFYYLFSFLFIVCVILAITCSQISVVMCYFQLCNEDYRWWWRSFLTGGSVAFYMFLYAVYYFFSKLQITSFVAGLLYFGYTFIMTLGFFVATGSIGYYSCYLFICKIYSSVKLD